MPLTLVLALALAAPARAKEVCHPGDVLWNNGPIKSALSEMDRHSGGGTACLTKEGTVKIRAQTEDVQVTGWVFLPKSGWVAVPGSGYSFARDAAGVYYVAVLGGETDWAYCASGTNGSFCVVTPGFKP